MAVIDNAPGWKIDHATGHLIAPTKKIQGLSPATVITDGASLANRLDQFATPTADIAMGSHKFTGLGPGTNEGDSVRVGDLLASNVIDVREEWCNGDPAGTHKWTTVASGTAAAVTSFTPTSDKDIGVVQLTTGSTSVGRAGLFLGTTGPSWILGADGQIYQLWKFQIPNLSDGTNTCRVILGFGDTSAAGDQVNGAYIVVDTTVTTKIQLSTAAASTRTLIPGTFDVLAATWVLARIKKSDASATFGLDVFTGGAWTDQGIAISTNIPTTALEPCCKIDKTVGISARTLLIDFCHTRILYPNGRI